MQIKLNKNHVAEWRYYNCPVDLPLNDGKVILTRFSNKHGYKFLVIMLNDSFYLTQSLYNPINNSESISIHVVKSVNDAKAIIDCMIQMITNYRKPIHETDA